MSQRPLFRLVRIWVNDIWGFKFDYKTAEVTARYHAALLPDAQPKRSLYQNFLEEMVADMKECVAIAHKAGVPDDKIMLDPGVGFGKRMSRIWKPSIM